MISRTFSPGLVFISETKLHGRATRMVRDSVGYEGRVHVDCEGRSGGLILIWKKDWELDMHSFSRGHIDSIIKSPDGVVWRFTGFYGNPAKSQCHHSWELIRRLRSTFSLPWLLADDFNEILYLLEREGGRDRMDSSMRQFREVVDDCELLDLGFQGMPLTWNNCQDPPDNVQKRLD